MKSSRFVTAPEQRLIVYVPQLESLLREARRPSPLIASMVDRQAPRGLNPDSPQAELATGRALPAAALTRVLDRPDDAGGIWLRADPIGLVPDLTAVWLQADASFGRGRWCHDLVEALGEEGLALELCDNGRGYIRLEQVPECRFAPPWNLGGSSMEHCLPEGPDARRWRRLLNETQVILQQHRRRADDPASVPGSLWFWGAGGLPERGTIQPRAQRIVGEDPQLLGLADWLGLPRRRYASSGAEPGGTLLEWPSRFEDSAETNLERLQDFLRPAWRRLRLGRISRLELAGRETAYRYSVADAWRVWR